MGQGRPSEKEEGAFGRLYGRRHGHKLSPHQANLLEQHLPDFAVVLPGSEDPAGDLDCRHLFGAGDKEVWLEIGYGGGEHLASQAVANPDVGFVGCEFYINGIAKLLTQIENQNLTNIRLYTDDSRDLLAKLAPATISRAFLLFPDPWPKKRHNKRRFVSKKTLDCLAHALKPEAEFRVATDIPDYCRWILAHIRDHGAFTWAAERPSDWRNRPEDWPATRFEAKAVRQGRTPVYLTFIRK